ncbi:MAG: hypothetical protein ACREKH_15815 [Candidatus Rokuibacteriota bacterium]
MLLLALLLASFEDKFPFPSQPRTVGAVLLVAVLVWVDYPLADLARDAYIDLRKRGWAWPIVVVLVALGVACVLLLTSLLGWGPWTLR